LEQVQGTMWEIVPFSINTVDNLNNCNKVYILLQGDIVLVASDTSGSAS
jgi:hypothetical protein